MGCDYFPLRSNEEVLLYNGSSTGSDKPTLRVLEGIIENNKTDLDIYALRVLEDMKNISKENFNEVSHFPKKKNRSRIFDILKKYGGPVAIFFAALSGAAFDDKNLSSAYDIITSSNTQSGNIVSGGENSCDNYIEINIPMEGKDSIFSVADTLTKMSKGDKSIDITNPDELVIEAYYWGNPDMKKVEERITNIGLEKYVLFLNSTDHEFSTKKGPFIKVTQCDGTTNICETIIKGYFEEKDGKYYPVECDVKL